LVWIVVALVSALLHLLAALFGSSANVGLDWAASIWAKIKDLSQ
jgi:hypothetical protein